MAADHGERLMTLDELLDELAGSFAGGACTVDLPDNWSQGRTAYGGITAALGAASARRAFADLPPLRSAQVAFIAPLSGQIRFVPTLLRQGRSATYVRVDASAEDRLGATMVLIFAGERESAVSKPPSPEPVGSGDSMAPPPHVMFAQNFDHSATAGTDGLVDRFVTLKAPSNANAEYELLAVADLLPPPALFNLPQVAPLSSMNWHIDLMEPARRSDDRRWRLKNVEEMHDHGLSTQQMWMWDGEGRLVASGRQLVTLFG
jgi:acyl-CoA thioesterase